MSPIKQEYNSSVERHMLANQKVWVQYRVRECLFFLSSTNLHEFYTEFTRGNMS